MPHGQKASRTALQRLRSDLHRPLILDEAPLLATPTQLRARDIRTVLFPGYFLRPTTIL